MSANKSNKGCPSKDKSNRSQSVEREASGVNKIVATRPRVISSNQFSPPKTYRLRDTII